MKESFGATGAPGLDVTSFQADEFPLDLEGDAVDLLAGFASMVGFLMMRGRNGDFSLLFSFCCLMGDCFSIDHKLFDFLELILVFEKTSKKNMIVV